MGNPKMRVLLSPRRLRQMGTPFIRHAPPRGIVVSEHMIAVQRLVFFGRNKPQVFQLIVETVEVLVMNVKTFGGAAVNCFPDPPILNPPTPARVNKTALGSRLFRLANPGVE